MMKFFQAPVRLRFFLLVGAAAKAGELCSEDWTRIVADTD